MRRCPLDYLPRREMTYFATGLYDDRFSVGPYDADIRHFGSKDRNLSFLPVDTSQLLLF